MLAAVGAAELGPGLWRWTAYHPEWRKEVGCVAYQDRGDLVLIDPLAPAEPKAAKRFWSALDRAVCSHAKRVHVLLTVRWHERHAPEVVGRYAAEPGSESWAPAGAVAHLSQRPDHAFVPEDRLPAGIRAVGTARPDEVVLWLPHACAVVAGDALLGGARKPLRVCPQSWLPSGVSREALAESLATLLTLPVEIVVPLHGEPITDGARDILKAALADAVR